VQGVRRSEGYLLGHGRRKEFHRKKVIVIDAYQSRSITIPKYKKRTRGGDKEPVKGGGNREPK